jgi:hypothetical protein
MRLPSGVPPRRIWVPSATSASSAPSRRDEAGGTQKRRSQTQEETMESDRRRCGCRSNPGAGTTRSTLFGQPASQNFRSRSADRRAKWCETALARRLSFLNPRNDRLNFGLTWTIRCIAATSSLHRPWRSHLTSTPGSSGDLAPGVLGGAESAGIAPEPPRAKARSFGAANSNLRDGTAFPGGLDFYVRSNPHFGHRSSFWNQVSGNPLPNQCL